ncbi:uncharacterized protein V1518DRAFT_194372 [Limtongia smithiae]|uniref:uncharacterized protein n=1 Tax=Limtongia smithiae TaxID=1125753 RepID=UPI0034CD2614
MAKSIGDRDLGLLTRALSLDALDGVVTRLQEAMGTALHAVGHINTPGGSGSASAGPTMQPAYVAGMPTGRELGTFLAVDVGGSTLRTAVIRLAPREGAPSDGHAEATAGDSTSKGSGILYRNSETIDDAIRNLDGHSFFAWIANQMQSAVEAAEQNGWLDRDNDGYVSAGLTWSFPLRQDMENCWRIAEMGKGFARMATEMQGWDVRAKLEEACAIAADDAAAPTTRVRLNAVVNDTAAVLLAGRRLDSRCRASVVVGTGLNAAVATVGGRDGGSGSTTIVNAELSLFGGGTGVLPRTRWDIELAHDLEQQGELPQPLEQMCSGRHIPEIARRALRDLLFQYRPAACVPTGLDRVGGLDALDMSQAESALDAARALQDFLATHPCRRETAALTVGEMSFVRAVFGAVSSRAAALVAAALVALWGAAATAKDEEANGDMDGSGARGRDAEVVVIACSGSVMEHYFSFLARAQGFVDALCGRGRGRGGVRLVLRVAHDSALWGAAVAAACA